MHESSNTSCVLLHCVTVVSRMLIQAEKGVWKRSRWELNPSHRFEPPLSDSVWWYSSTAVSHLTSAVVSSVADLGRGFLWFHGVPLLARPSSRSYW